MNSTRRQVYMFEEEEEIGVIKKRPGMKYPKNPKRKFSKQKYLILQCRVDTQRLSDVCCLVWRFVNTLTICLAGFPFTIHCLIEVSRLSIRRTPWCVFFGVVICQCAHDMIGWFALHDALLACIVRLDTDVYCPWSYSGLSLPEW
jgi:hypothetical protein